MGEVNRLRGVNNPLQPLLSFLDTQLPVQSSFGIKESKDERSQGLKRLEALGVDPEILSDPELLGKLLEQMGKFQKRALKRKQQTRPQRQ